MLTALDAGAADVRVGDDRLSGVELQRAVGAFARGVAGHKRVAVVARPCLQTVVAVAGALVAGCEVVPLNPVAGESERSHMLADSAPDLVIDADDVDLSAPSRPAAGGSVA